MASRGTAMVTGAGSGIGQAAAEALAACGFEVILASLEPEPPPLSTRMRYVQIDIADLRQHAKLLESESKPACLVNCAGVTSLVRGDMLELTPESFDRSVGINLRGTFFLTQSVARLMLADRDARPTRSIITVGSLNAEVVGETRADYCITKAGLAMMTKLFAARLGTSGIAVYEVRPGIVRTPMTAPAAERYDHYIAEGGIPMNRWGEPADIAAVIATLARGDIPYTTGIAIDVAGGMQLHRI
jgi:3-oxoacyl-[acyl-carrier protein] reductase